jgi:hypothetical protein
MLDPPTRRHPPLLLFLPLPLPSAFLPFLLLLLVVVFNAPAVTEFGSTLRLTYLRLSLKC